MSELFFILASVLVLFFIYKFKQEKHHRKLAEEKLKEREILYLQLNETVIDVIWKTDKAYYFTYISPSVEHILGYKPEELIGHHVFELFTQEGIALTMQRMQQRKIEEEQGIFSAYSILEVQHKSKTGELVWGEIVSKALLDSNNNLLGHHGISRDITKRKANEREKEILYQELDHRVKNNLQIISSIVFLHSSQKDTTQSLEDIHNTISAISLAHDKLNHNTTQNTLEIKHYISDLLDNLLSSSVLKIEKEVNSQNIHLNAQHSITLGIIINEFISNAIKYAFKEVSSPKIKVDIKEDKNVLTILVSDNGTGMKEKTEKAGLGIEIIKILSKSKFKNEAKFYNNQGTFMELKIPLSPI